MSVLDPMEVYSITIWPLIEFQLKAKNKHITQILDALERKVNLGLRKTLVTQAKRLEWLTQQRYDAIQNQIDSEVPD